MEEGEKAIVHLPMCAAEFPAKRVEEDVAMPGAVI